MIYSDKSKLTKLQLIYNPYYDNQARCAKNNMESLAWLVERVADIKTIWHSDLETHGSNIVWLITFKSMEEKLLFKLIFA